MSTTKTPPKKTAPAKKVAAKPKTPAPEKKVVAAKTVVKKDFQYKLKNGTVCTVSVIKNGEAAVIHNQVGASNYTLTKKVADIEAALNKGLYIKM